MLWIVVLEKTFESPLDCKIKPVNSKGNQPWTFIGKNDEEAEAPILWPPDEKSQLIWKDPDTGEKLKAKKRRGQQRMKWFNSTTNSIMYLSKLWEIVKDSEAWHFAVHGVAKSQTQLSDWTEQTYNITLVSGILYNSYLIFLYITKGSPQCTF